MNRLALRIRGTQLRALPISTRATAAITSHPIRGYATSSPKKAEEASAQSGGSRSKDAMEDRAQVETGENPTEDRLARGGAPGRTGGGEPLASSENAPPQPKVNNASVPGEGKNDLSKEQQKEVDEHNKDFENKHDRASPAAEDKVDKGFWKGHGGVKGE
ncbi:hypothetical protein VMCG_05380 [Cytospora schulzeri]|uniref:Succinate dehydrogenase assembly factor 4, mitochondrial n=1 Tax=Cytospora schulzeri TaxID=448051 RepID=A0A423WJY6_9PEZI|nr:hypothetical protein VMCG_05380 [Valsa malicola]